MGKKRNEWKRDTTFRSLELCLAKFIQSTLEWLFPPADAPIEAVMGAQEWRESRIPRVTALLAEGRQILKEIGRHYRWLSGQSTPRFERAIAPDPDAYKPLSSEDARALENLSRRAQLALQVQAKELPSPERECDTAFKLLELRLAECIQVTLEWLSADAPVEGMRAAQEQWKSRMREVTALLTEERQLLTEIGRNRRLLCEESTAILEWANVPDVYIPTTIEEARVLEQVSRRASTHHAGGKGRGRVADHRPGGNLPDP